MKKIMLPLFLLMSISSLYGSKKQETPEPASSRLIQDSSTSAFRKLSSSDSSLQTHEPTAKKDVSTQTDISELPTIQALNKLTNVVAHNSHLLQQVLLLEQRQQTILSPIFQAYRRPPTPTPNDSIS